MPIFTLFRILACLFLLYFAWPYIPQAVSSLEKYFWGAWLVFFLFVIGGNLATLFKITAVPVMEQKEEVKRRMRQY